MRTVAFLAQLPVRQMSDSPLSRESSLRVLGCPLMGDDSQRPRGRSRMEADAGPLESLGEVPEVGLKHIGNM